MRSPVDIHLAVVQPVAPFAQRGRRQMQRGGVLPHAHPTPVHRLDVHRPERLEGAIAHIRAHAETEAGAPLPALFLSLAALLTTQFRLIFRMFASRLLAGEVLQPTIERCRRQTMLTAILRPAEPAPTPGFNVNRPQGCRGLFSKRLKVTGGPPPCEGARHAAQLHYAIRVQTPDAYAPT